MPEVPSFPCVGGECAACCRRAGLVGLPTTEDGMTCIHLTSEGRCSIYKDRPDICRVNRLWALTRAEAHRTGAPRVSLGEWHEHNLSVCRTMAREDGLGDELLVRIGE